MLGAIAGDIIGSIYEGRPLKGHWSEFPLFSRRSHFTDDTVMTLAVAVPLCENLQGAELEQALADSLRFYGRLYPHAGYGGGFRAWLRSETPAPYNSFGNGSAMRASAAGWAAKSLAEAESLAASSAIITHNHPEGIKGAQAVAGCIYLARSGHSREEIMKYAETRHGYDVTTPLSEIRKTYRFDVTCQGSVPQAIRAFIESEDFEQAVRKAIWLRGDADTQAAIAGSIAEAFYGGVPEAIQDEAIRRLDGFLIDSLRSTAFRLNINGQAG